MALDSTGFAGVYTAPRDGRTSFAKQQARPETNPERLLSALDRSIPGDGAEILALACKAVAPACIE